MDRRSSTRGFTLAELLIVVAIIAVLVAIAIPVFNNQLEKSREATDLANVRSAYAEVMTAAITEDKAATYDGQVMYDSTTGLYTAVVSPLAQKQPKWQSNVPITIGGVSSGADGGSNGLGTWNGDPQPGGSCTIIYGRDGAVIINWGDGSSGGGGGNTPAKPGDSNKVTELPTTLGSGETLSIQTGHIYKFNGRYYIAQTDADFNSYYYVTPGSNNWTYIEVSKSTNVRTKPDYTENGQGKVRDLKAGDVYFDGKDYYISKVDSSHQNVPSENDGNGNWIKINYN